MPANTRSAGVKKEKEWRCAKIKGAVF